MHLIECLDARRMFALAEFEVLGTSGDDRISVGVDDNGDLFINVNDNIQTAPADRLVRILGLEGNDNIAVGVPLVRLNESGQVVQAESPRFFVDAGAGNDTVFGSHADDLITGSGGDDRIYGGGGNDEISGGNGRDTLFGGAGDDTLLGGRGNDRLQGGEGTNLISGGDGTDKLFHRIPGADNYLVNAPLTTVGALTYYGLYYHDGTADLIIETEVEVVDGVSLGTIPVSG